MNESPPTFRFAIFYTKKLEFLVSCIETGSYGEPVGAFRFKQYDNIGELRNLQIGDRVFLRWESKILAGPFILTAPHQHFVIDESEGCWHKVNIDKTPKELHPVWLYDKPWCFFFDLVMAAQVNYRLFSELPAELQKLPPTKFIPSQLGEKLWAYLEENGSPFADFLQRQAPSVRYRQRLQQFYNADSSLQRSAVANPSITLRYKARIGAYVRSKSEQIIADCLHDNGFRFEYERTLFMDGNVIHPDFYLPDCNLIIEHLGLYESNAKYREDWAWREALYKKNNRKFLVLRESDVADIHRNLLSKLSAAGCSPTTSVRR